MGSPNRTRKILIVIAHGFVGWALCGATMGIGMATTSMENAMVIHAAAVPFIFGTLTFAYFRRIGDWHPLKVAGAFLGVVIVLDVLVVALLIERSFEMFRSPLGTWLPFALAFLSTLLAGKVTRRADSG